jgi:AraC-like DNA-binding protein
MNLSNQPILTSIPVAPLRPYISHYWLSLDNIDESYSIAPDGVVDVVVVVGASTLRVDAFGTTTKRSEVQLEVGSHYLGIRFKPGQSRHFLDAKTSELTNAVHSSEGIFLPDISGVTESILSDSLFTRLDAALLGHLKRRSPSQSRIDDVIRYIEVTHGPLRISELASMYGKSRRQFERTFLDVVGVSAKLFAEIIRFRRASALLVNSILPLAQIAADIGYTDQSHFTHEFVRFFGLPPIRAREHAAFLQDTNCFNNNNIDSPNL